KVLKMKIAHTFWNHPKKSLVGSVIAGYVGKWMYTKYTDYEFRLEKCRYVHSSGKERINQLQIPKRITLILNPAAKHGKAMKLFEKNASPLLQLSGCEVNVIRLEYEGHAKALMAELENGSTDMIVAAGGDGTVNEVVTGLLRRADHANWSKVPIGIIPLGNTNSICQRLSFSNSFNSQAKWILSSTCNVLSSNIRWVDALEVKSELGKSAYVLTDMAWGSYRDTFVKESKYWYFGPIKTFMTHFFSLFKTDIRTPRLFQLAYNPPKPIPKDIEKKTEEAKLMAVNSLISKLLIIEVEEPLAEEKYDAPIEEYGSIEFMASVNNHDPHDKREKAGARIVIESSDFNWLNFLREGPKRIVAGKPIPVKPETVIDCSEFQLVPLSSNESWFGMDNEKFEAFSCHATVIPNCL
uniref:Acylglycerol kinase, mitochondrial n=1 Tax=Ciona savignyi TaxID=51511 RepID=H2YDB4_CIOSA